MSLLLLFNQAPVHGGAFPLQKKQVVTASGTVSFPSSAGTPTAQGVRTYGRINQTNGFGGTWVEITTDANGFNDQVNLTTLAQVLKLNLGESPFYANYGIPAQQSVMTQVFPDYYVMQTQTQFSGFFASLVIARVSQVFPPVYSVGAVGHSGAALSNPVAT